ALADHRQRLARLGPDVLGIGRHRAPAEEYLSLLPGHRLDRLLAEGAIVLVLGEEDHPHAVLAGPRELNADLLAGCTQEGMRHLEMKPRAVAAAGVTARRAPMGEILQQGQPLPDDRVRRYSLGVGDEADPAGVTLVCRVVKALYRRHPAGRWRCGHTVLPRAEFTKKRPPVNERPLADQVRAPSFSRVSSPPLSLRRWCYSYWALR